MLRCTVLYCLYSTVQCSLRGSASSTARHTSPCSSSRCPQAPPTPRYDVNRLRVVTGPRYRCRVVFALHYASSVYSYGHKSVRTSVTSWSSVKTSWFWHLGFLRPFVHCVLRNSDICKIKMSNKMSKQGSCLEKEIMQGTMPGARRRGRLRTAWMDNIRSQPGFLKSAHQFLFPQSPILSTSDPNLAS